MKTRIPLTTCAWAAAAALALTACGSADAPPAQTPSATAEPSVEPTPEPRAESALDHPDWAYPVTTPGEVIATFTVGDLQVEVAQVGILPAPSDGAFIDPATSELIIAEGDDLVVVNYVVTNIGDDVNLPDGLIDITGRYENWPYSGPTKGLRDYDLFDAAGVNRTDAIVVPGDDREVFPFRSGQAYSYGDSFVHQPGSTMTFEARFVPVDDAGERLTDNRAEAEANAVIS